MDKVNQLEEYLKSLVKEEVDRRDFSLKKEDADQIVKGLFSELDKVIAKSVKEHLVEIADFIKIKFGKEKK